MAISAPPPPRPPAPGARQPSPLHLEACGPHGRDPYRAVSSHREEDERGLSRGIPEAGARARYSRATMDHDDWRVTISFTDRAPGVTGRDIVSRRKLAEDARRGWVTTSRAHGGSQVFLYAGQRSPPGRLGGSPATCWPGTTSRRNSPSTAGIPLRNGGRTQMSRCRGPRPSARQSTSSC